jgi:hypothetical protein
MRPLGTIFADTFALGRRLIGGRSTALAHSFKRYLKQWGYSAPLIRADFCFGQDGYEQKVPLVAFARQPPDARTACIAVIDAAEDDAKAVAGYREVGAPVVLACHEKGVQWWKQGAEHPEPQEKVAAERVEQFASEQGSMFAPSRLYQAKTQGLIDPQLRLPFVDELLIPAVERDMGKRLGEALGEVFASLRMQFPVKELAEPLAHQLLRDAFWLLAAKLLHDKDVPAFAQLDLAETRDVFHRVGKHYGEPSQLSHYKPKYLKVLADAAPRIRRLGHLGQVTTESLAYVYENTLVTPELRRTLGIHSTPPYLADYILGRLQSRIAEIPQEERHVFEPACGHGAFLVSAMRRLRDLLPEGKHAHRYLQEHLHGLEYDPTSLEIARLSLTLADIPNPNGWHLLHGDMFDGDAAPDLASAARIFLANPPFEDFSEAERKKYRHRYYDNKAEEMLHRLMPRLPTGAVFGLVMPHGLLRSKSATSIRQQILRDFELDEVLLLPDKVFAHADAETAILLGRKLPPSKTSSTRFRRVREKELEDFRATYSARSERQVAQEEFGENHDSEFYVPELQEVWERGRHWTFNDIAVVGRGLVYKGKDLPKGAKTWSEERFDGAVRGYASITPENLQLHGEPKEFWLNLKRDTKEDKSGVVQRPNLGTDRRKPQVLVTHRPTRQPWRLRAVMDAKGRPTRDVFLIVRPKAPDDPPLELIWALCNSSYANAYIHTHATKRDITIEQLRKMPVPHYSSADAALLIREVRAYFAAAQQLERTALRLHSDEDACRKLLRRIDALVMRLYDLPPRLERRLLALFDDEEERPGVPFQWEPYLPRDLQRAVPLYVYLAVEDGALSALPALEVLTGHLAAERLVQLSGEQLEEEIAMLYEELASLSNLRSELKSTKALEERVNAQQRRLRKLQDEEARRISEYYDSQLSLPSEREPALIEEASRLLQRYGHPTS